MVSTKRSLAYTPHALRSFFLHTQFGSDDRFILIDNDGVVPDALLAEFPNVECVIPKAPRGFAANMNAAMRRAAESKSTLYFLNNDLIFTPGWREIVDAAGEVLSSPCSNREVQCEYGAFRFERSLSLDHYRAHVSEFEAMVRAHRARVSPGFLKLFLLPFFCIRVPYSVYSRVGMIDESFGLGGAEDGDYCLRAALEEIPLVMTRHSLILHFSGKSTWDGGESDAERDARCAKYQKRFVEKWGPRLANLVIGYHQNVLDSEDLKGAVEKGNFKYVVEELMRRDGIHYVKGSEQVSEHE